MAKFADVLTIVNGKNQKRVENPNGQYPIYGSGGIIGYADDYICDGNTVVIGRKGSINTPIFVETPFWNVDTAFGLCANPIKLQPKYLYYFCEKFDFEQLNTTVTIPSLTKANLLKIEIPLPPLAEQRKIAAVLDKVSDLIAKRRQQLTKLDELVKARFVEMFGDRVANEKHWDRKALQECATFFNGKAHEQVIDEKGQYILVTSKFIASNQKEYRKTNEILFPLHRGDICMVMSDVPNGRALAKCVLIDQDNKYTLNQRICCFRGYEMNAIFLLYMLNRHEYFLSFDDGDSQTNLRKKDILACPIIFPPFKLQNQFAAFVEQTDKTKTTIKHSLDKLETLKKALMQKYFGE